MGDAQEEIYSTMFSSFKHPARRKILRLLSEKPLTFSEMLNLLGVSSSNLTYHLESLGELVTQENSVYKLSTFGAAAVSTMKIVEEAPEVQPKRRSSSLRWKALAAGLLIAIVVFASIGIVQYSALNQAVSRRDVLQSQYNQLLAWSAITNNAITFLQNVAQIDTSHYQATLLSNTVEQRSDLGGILEQVMTYSLTSIDSKMDVVFRFRNNELSWYQTVILDGSPAYSQPQPHNILDSAKNMLARLSTFENTSYLGNMTSMLSLVTLATPNIEIAEGNIRLNVTVSDNSAQIVFIYTDNGIDFSPKNLTLIFDNNGDLTQLTDDWYLFTIGSTAVNISSDKAVELARNALNGFSWTANGTTVSNFNVLSQPVSVVFHPNTKNSLALYPQWTVTFYLDKVYAGGVNSITVEVWADTRNIAQIKTQIR